MKWFVNCQVVKLVQELVINYPSAEIRVVEMGLAGNSFLPWKERRIFYLVSWVWRLEGRAYDYLSVSFAGNGASTTARLTALKQHSGASADCRARAPQHNPWPSVPVPCHSHDLQHSLTSRRLTLKVAIILLTLAPITRELIFHLSEIERTIWRLQTVADMSNRGALSCNPIISLMSWTTSRKETKLLRSRTAHLDFCSPIAR